MPRPVVNILSKTKCRFKQLLFKNECKKIFIPQQLCYSTWFFGNGNGFQKAINSAEKYVGYPTTLSSLKYLVDEKPSNFIGLAKKLVGSGHPLLSIARDLLSQDAYGSHHLGGLWVLLLSKAAGKCNKELLDDDFVQGIHKYQRTLVEATELIHTAYLIHRSMLDINETNHLEILNKKTLSFGNKLSVLGGDFLLGKASLQLSKLNNTDVVGIMSQVIGDMAEGSTLEAISKNPLTMSIVEWEEYAYLLQGSLMANSCQSTVLLTGHPRQIQEHAFEFGKSLHFAQKSWQDMESFHNNKETLKQSNLALLLSLKTSKLLREKYHMYLDHESSITLSKELRHEILTDVPNIAEQMQDICEGYISECKRNVALFQHQETINIIYSVLDKICEN